MPNTLLASRAPEGARDEPVRAGHVSVGRHTSRVALGAILLAGAILRWTHVRWDESSHLHPDERFTSMVEEALTFPRHISEYFDSAHSPLNPYNRGHDSYVYGTLPL
ncbi:MAG TPA: hypothetical protein VK780_00255, partial [Thermoanaerobaculia bacterium]|nr:hypothetical protein [Thermoanaerobaculia bacterium]